MFCIFYFTPWVNSLHNIRGYGLDNQQSVKVGSTHRLISMYMLVIANLLLSDVSKTQILFCIFAILYR